MQRGGLTVSPCCRYRDGEDMRNRRFLDRKRALVRLLRNSEADMVFNEHLAEEGPIAFAHACRLGDEGIVSKKVDSTYRSGPCRVWIKARNPAQQCSRPLIREANLSFRRPLRRREPSFPSAPPE
jgi:hypothetical protein